MIDLKTSMDEKYKLWIIVEKKSRRVIMATNDIVNYVRGNTRTDDRVAVIIHVHRHLISTSHNL